LTFFCYSLNIRLFSRGGQKQVLSKESQHVIRLLSRLNANMNRKSTCYLNCIQTSIETQHVIVIISIFCRYQQKVNMLSQLNADMNRKLTCYSIVILITCRYQQKVNMLSRCYLNCMQTCYFDCLQTGKSNNWWLSLVCGRKKNIAELDSQHLVALVNFKLQHISNWMGFSTF